jgi:glutaredoxin
MKALIFTTPTCIKCKKVKEYINSREDLEKEFIDASTSEGLRKAQKFEVRSVPSVAFLDGENFLGLAQDIDEIEEYVSVVIK